MNALIQRWLICLRLLLSLLAVLWAWRNGNVIIGFALLGLILGLSGIVLFLSFATISCINYRDLAPRFTSMPGAWLREWMSWERVFSWQQPFAEHRFANFLPAQGGVSAGRGVMLVHGFTCNRALWNPWMRRLRRQGTPFVALTLEPAFDCIDAYVEQMEAGLQASLALGGPPPLIVAHSMGGLVVRAWLREHSKSQLGLSRVAHIMTLGSPHAGTLMARLSPAINARQMRCGSSWLAALAGAESPQLAALFTCYNNYFDQVVCPARTAVLPGSRAIEVAGRGHLSMLFNDRIFADLQHLLAQKEGP